MNWNGDGSKIDGVIGKVILPGLLSPIVAGLVAAVGTWLVFQITARITGPAAENGFRWGQIGSASLVSLAHGTNDAQKTMGVITLALIASGHWTSTTSIPIWVKIVCALAIASGTWIGGWRVIRTLGKGLVEISPRQGLSAESSSAAVILVSSQMGFALSTTHVATGSVLGSGVGRPGAQVRWRVAGRMLVAWLLTLPAAAVVGAVMWLVTDVFGRGALGAGVVFVVLLAVAVTIWIRSRVAPVGAHNVNDAWDGDTEPARELERTAA